MNANADTPGRWDQMGTDGRPRPNREHMGASCFEPNSPIIHKLRHVAPFVSCLLHGRTILVRRFGGQHVPMEDFKFVSSRNVVDRSHSRGREGDGFDPDTTSATNQKRGGSGVSSVVGKPCSVAASAFAVLCPYYTATSSDLLTFLHVFHLAST